MIGSDTLRTGTCPTTHPFAVSGGTECCKTDLELRSNSCENGASMRCPAGDGKLCTDGNANGGKLLIILILFDSGLISNQNVNFLIFGDTYI